LWESERAKTLEKLLTSLIPHNDPGGFNEALMELGQTVCLRSRPLCDRCPLSPSCLAFAESNQNAIPARSHSAATPKTSRRILLLRDRDGSGSLEIWIAKKTKGLLKELWLFPPSIDRAASKHGTVPEDFDKLKEIGTLPSRIHNYTRYREELRPVVYFAAEKPLSRSESFPACRWGKDYQDGRWVEMKDIHRYPMPSVYRKIVSDLREMLEKQSLGSPPRS
jgi:A/G-specific adenine glycosylase